MRLIEILQEDASAGSISAGDCAGFMGTLFKGGIISLPTPTQPKKKKYKGIKVIKFGDKI